MNLRALVYPNRTGVGIVTEMGRRNIDQKKYVWGIKITDAV